jgi:DNA-binding transcriptional MocR family regulator
VSDLGSPVIDQHALAELIATGAYERHLRQLRRGYRARRDALTDALARWLPGATVRGVSAGIQLYVELPADLDQHAVVEAAGARGVAVEGAAPLLPTAGARSALVLGFARLPAHRLVEAVRVLADAAATTRPAGLSALGSRHRWR